MVDNFKLIRSYIEKEINSTDWKEGDCYYIQLLRRQSDDPMINGQKDKKYHGNMHSRSIKDYLIKSLEHFDDVEEDIKTLCNTFNVRAYIRLNKRNYKNIALAMLKHIAEQCASGETYSSPFHLVASACGQVCQAGDNKTWLLDVDKEYLPFKQEIIEMICQCEPHKRNIVELIDEIKDYLTYPMASGLYPGNEKNYYKKENFFIVPTKSGEHIICKPFNMQTFSELWKNNSMKDMPIVSIHKDNPTLLFVPDCAYKGVKNV